MKGNRRAGSKLSLLAAVLTAVLLIPAAMPASGEPPGDAIHISDADDLMDVNGLLSASSPFADDLSKYYVLDNDIDITGMDLNGGAEMTVEASAGADLYVEVDFPYVSEEVSELVAWLDGEEVDITSVYGSFYLTFSHSDTFLVISGEIIVDYETVDVFAEFFIPGDFDSGEWTEDCNGNFSPMGSDAYPFIGVFDGNGHSIRGLDIRTGSSGLGFFGAANGASIHDLSLYGKASGNSINGGGIAGRVYNGALLDVPTPALIYKCANYMDVTVYFGGIQSHVGGIAGLVDPDVAMFDNLNEGALRSNAASYTAAGGIVGTSLSPISSSANIGGIYVSTPEWSHSGGIVGNADGPDAVVSESFNTGNITSTGITGGIAGRASADIHDCYNTGNIYAAYESSGGIAGTDGLYEIAIFNTYNIGSVAGGMGAGIAALYDAIDPNTIVVNSYYLTGTASGIVSDPALLASHPGTVDFGEARGTFSSGEKSQSELRLADSTANTTYYTLPSGGDAIPGWNIGEIAEGASWVLDGDGFNDGHPVLRTFMITAFIYVDPADYGTAAWGAYSAPLPYGDGVLLYSFMNYSGDLTAVPNQGRAFSGWTYDAFTSASETLDIRWPANHIFELGLAFGIAEYTVTSVADDGSEISPSGARRVAYGGDLRVGFGAKEGYRLTDVRVDGASVPSLIDAGEYIFTDIRRNHTIAAISDAMLPVTINADGGGSVEYSVDGGYRMPYDGTFFVGSGSVVTLYAFADEGRVARWSDGTVGSSATFTVTSPLTVDVRLDAFEESPNDDAEDDDGIFNLTPEQRTAAIIATILANVGITAALIASFINHGGSLLELSQFFWLKRTYRILPMVSGGALIVGGKRTSRRSDYVFKVLGKAPEQEVAYRIGNSSEWGILEPDENGGYTIPGNEVKGRVTIRVGDFV